MHAWTYPRALYTATPLVVGMVCTARVIHDGSSWGAEGNRTKSTCPTRSTAHESRGSSWPDRETQGGNTTHPKSTGKVTKVFPVFPLAPLLLLFDSWSLTTPCPPRYGQYLRAILGFPAAPCRRRCVEHRSHPGFKPNPDNASRYGWLCVKRRPE